MKTPRQPDDWHLLRLSKRSHLSFHLLVLWLRRRIICPCQSHKRFVLGEKAIAQAFKAIAEALEAIAPCEQIYTARNKASQPCKQSFAPRNQASPPCK
ncbi:MAG: hypothetical protein WBD47_06055 [Phormidesmis sp.]